ncbi:MAG: DUF6799 domain-containing protein [Bacteroidota bacterium]
MKKITFLAAACALSFSTFAGNGSNEHGEKYCAKLKNGKLLVMHEGTEVTSDITLNNGTKISKDGTVWKKDGAKMVLKEGECVDIEGEVMDKSIMNDKPSNDKMNDNSNKSKMNDKSSNDKMNKNSTNKMNGNSQNGTYNNSGEKKTNNSNTNGNSNDNTIDHSNDKY